MATYTSGQPVKWDDHTTAIFRFDEAKVRTSYFCTGSGYIAGNTTYLPRVKQPGNIKLSMFEEGKTSGSASVGYGDISLINLDGGLDHLRSYGLDGRKIVTKIVTATGPAVLFTGTQEQPVFDWDSISFRVRDKQALLQVALQPNKYLGNNALPAGLEGLDDIKDQPKPLLFGEVHNISPVLVNTSTLTYQANDGALYSIPAAYDRGVALTLGADYATPALLQAATVAAGTYATCLAAGYLRLGSTPSGQITCNAIQGATAALRTAAQIALQLVTRVVPQSDVYAQGIISVDAANSAVIGIFVKQETTIAAVLAEVTDSIGAWSGFDGNGKWDLRIFTAPGNNPLAVLTAADILSIERLQTNDQGRGVPAYKYTLEYDKNFTLQTDLAGAANRLPYTALEYRTATPAVDSGVLTKHLLAVEMSGRSLLVDPAAAAAEATRKLNLYKAERDPLRVKCAEGALRYAAGGWWDDGSISELPFVRDSHATVIHNNYLYMLGGTDDGGLTRFTTVTRLDLDNPTGGWDDAAVTDLPSGRFGLQACVYGDYLYVVGGNTSAAFENRILRLDLTNPTGAWDEAAATWPDNRYFHAIAVHNNYLYMLGGMISGVKTASVIRLDLNNPLGAWDDAGVTNLPAARDLLSAVVYGGYLYVLNGRIGSNPTASVIRLDLANPSSAWDDAGVTNTAIARYGVAAVLIDNVVYLFGGYAPLVSADTAAIKLDLNNPAGAWDVISLPALPEGRVYPTAVSYAGSIFLLAGYTAAGVSVGNTYRYRSNDNVLDRAKLFERGQDIALKLDRYSWESSKNFKVLGSEVNRETEEITLDLWG